MRTLCTALFTVALAAIALVATAASRLSAGFLGYERFQALAEYPWNSELTQKTSKLPTEKVIQINKSTQKTLFEIENAITGRFLKSPSLLGNGNCYVGYRELTLKSGGELSMTAIGCKYPYSNSLEASVERSNQTEESTHELSRLDNHLA